MTRLLPLGLGTLDLLAVGAVGEQRYDVGVEADVAGQRGGFILQRLVEFAKARTFQATGKPPITPPAYTPSTTRDGVKARARTERKNGTGAGGPQVAQGNQP